MSTLTRGQAIDLVNACEDNGTLAELAQHWDVPGHWNEYVAADEWAAVLRDIVDEHCIDGDRIRSYGPSDDDETDLTDFQETES